jgi:hypothetical protein
MAGSVMQNSPKNCGCAEVLQDSGLIGQFRLKEKGQGGRAWGLRQIIGPARVLQIFDRGRALKTTLPMRALATESLGSRLAAQRWTSFARFQLCPQMHWFRPNCDAKSGKR